MSPLNSPKTEEKDASSPHSPLLLILAVQYNCNQWVLVKNMYEDTWLESLITGWYKSNGDIHWKDANREIIEWNGNWPISDESMKELGLSSSFQASSQS